MPDGGGPTRERPTEGADGNIDCGRRVGDDVANGQSQEIGAK
jgi:hypothetical protein